MSSPHRLANPTTLAKPIGYSHAVVPAPGRTVYVAGQTAMGADGEVRGETIAEQLEAAAANLIEALREAGGRPEHIVAMQIFTTDIGEYRRQAREIGDAYRRHLGRHFPAMALLGVSELYDPAAKVELMCTAVIPEEPA
jgi:enamine deaminase RidA (YjgF/YER057c/UK114 family)